MFQKMSPKIGNPDHLTQKKGIEILILFPFFFFLSFFWGGLRVHALLPARSASPCARSRAAPVERTAAAVVAKPRREQSREEPRGAQTAGSAERSATYTRNFASPDSGDLVRSGIIAGGECYHGRGDTWRPEGKKKLAKGFSFFPKLKVSQSASLVRSLGKFQFVNPRNVESLRVN